MSRDPDPTAKDESGLPAPWAELRRSIELVTPARLFAGRAGPSYCTADLLRLRTDRAQARDAVDRPLLPGPLLGPAETKLWRPLFVSTLARDKSEYLVRPDRGRLFDAESLERIAAEADREADLQLIVGDGLSVAAVESNALALLSPLRLLAANEGWSLGRLLVVRFCRVGILNHVGDLIAPKLALLLIGERPGLAVADSLGAYMAYRPASGRTDADRNVISNIHARGVSCEQAAHRIVALAREMIRRRKSGVEVKEPSLLDRPPLPPIGLADKAGD